MVDLTTTWEGPELVRTPCAVRPGAWDWQLRLGLRIYSLDGWRIQNAVRLQVSEAEDAAEVRDLTEAARLLLLEWAGPLVAEHPQFGGRRPPPRLVLAPPSRRRCIHATDDPAAPR